MRRSIVVHSILLLLLVMGIGCRPKGILSSSQMEDALVMLHRTEGVIHAMDYNYGHDPEVVRIYSAALEQMGLTQAQVDSSLIWYTDHPQIFNKIYPRVTKRLEAELQAERDRQNIVAVKVANRIPLRDWQVILSEYIHGYPVCLYHAPDPIPYCWE